MVFSALCLFLRCVVFNFDVVSNPIVEAHQHSADLKQFHTASASLRYEAFVWASQNNDEALINFILSTPAFPPNFELTGSLLGLALNNNLKLFKKVIKKCPTDAFEAIKSLCEYAHVNQRGHNIALMKQFTPFFSVLAPQIVWPLSADPEEGDFYFKTNWHARCLMHFAPLSVFHLFADVSQFTAPSYAKQFYLLVDAILCGEVSQETDRVWAEKVQWLLTHSHFDKRQISSLLERAVLNGFPQVGKVLTNALETIPLKVFNALFSRYDTQSIEVFSDLLKKPPSAQECKQIFRDFFNSELRISVIAHHNDSDKKLQIFLPFLQKIKKEGCDIRPIINNWLTEACDVFFVKFKKEFPKLWDWDKELWEWVKAGWMSEQLKDMCLASPSFEKNKNIFYATIIVNHRAYPDLVMRFPSEVYANSHVAKKIFVSGNAFLIQKCLDNGGKILCIEQLFHLIDCAPTHHLETAWTNCVSASHYMEQLGEALGNPSLLTPSVLDFLHHHAEDLRLSDLSQDSLTILGRATLRLEHPLLDVLAPYQHWQGELIETALGEVPHKRVKMLRRALQWDNASCNNSEALMTAVGVGKDVVEVLTPLCNPRANNSAALALACKRGDVEVVAHLLPLSYPKDNDSQSLKQALEARHLEIAVMLLPHSDVALVKKQLDDQDTQDFLEECLSRWEKDKLTKIFSTVHRSARDHKKII